jgi:hypothetical protein
MDQYEVMYVVERMKPELVRARAAAVTGKMIRF